LIASFDYNQIYIKTSEHLNVKSKQHNVKSILISEERLKTNLRAILQGM